MAVHEWRLGKSLWETAAFRNRERRGSSEDSATGYDSQPLQRKRTSKPKVRTGCVSCKRRHVKCDERKPGCERCEGFGITCEGYSPPRSRKEKQPAPPKSRVLLPRPREKGLQPLEAQPAAAEPLAVPAPQRIKPLIMARAPSTGLDLVGDDGSYWDIFQHMVVKDLSGFFRCDFWSVVSLRESTKSKCVLHSVLSIGAHCNAVTASRDNATPPSHREIHRQKHRQAAFAHHAKALTYLREDMKLPSPDTRLAMIATLLFIAFENMQGNYHAAGTLIKTGIKIVRNYSTQSPSSSQASSRESSPASPVSAPPRPFLRPATNPPSLQPLVNASKIRMDEEVAEMKQMFARHSTVSVYIPFPHGKYAWHLLLDPALCSPPANLGLGSRPTSIKQARAAWDFHFPHMGTFILQSLWHNLHASYPFEAEKAAREQKDHLRWLSDFGSVLDELKTQAEEDDSPGDARGDKQPGKAMAHSILAVHHLAATIFVKCCLDPTEMMYDQFVPQFASIVLRCRAFVTSRVPGSFLGFTNEVGLISPLGFVACKCRDKGIRLEALRVLAECDWRESSWDRESTTLGLVGLMRLEEQGADQFTGTIPAESRWAWTNGQWEFETKKLVIEFTKVLPDTNGEYARKTVTEDLV